jgi:hypothetical protein
MNAFAYPLNGSKYLVVCPGLILSAIGEGKSDENNIANFLFVLGHEWGHHIDSTDFPAIYWKYRNCLMDHYADGLADPGPAPRPDGTIDIMDYLAERVKARRVDSHLHEITADFWGQQTVLAYQRSIFGPLTPEGLLYVLRQGVGILCHGTDTGKDHPAGAFRIGLMLRNNPGIMRVMGCARTHGNKPSCTL